MKKLEITMDTGEKFYRSTMVSLGKPYKGFAQIKVDIDSWASYTYFQDDYKNIIFPSHISTVRIIDLLTPNTETKTASTTYSRGVCECCGQWFAEETRRYPLKSQIWTHILEQHMPDGVCPACYNTYAILNGMDRERNSNEWNKICREEVDKATSEQELSNILDEYIELVPSIKDIITSKLEELISAETVRTKKIAEQKAKAIEIKNAEKQRAKERVCVGCKKRVHVRLTNNTEKGILCDFCFHSRRY